ncbi:MAG: T9SS type A sorting domain-containing protein [Candidatus Kapabacteria bacterium]|nr:T9SS type A sorting domain-containing protein [Candidatus Kapabacteria bacterium]
MYYIFLSQLQNIASKEKARLSLLAFSVFIFLFALSSQNKSIAACVTAPSGMVAWWSFDETSGTTATDLTSVATSYSPTNTNNSGTKINGVTNNNSGEVATSYYFPGLDNNYVQVSNVTDLDFPYSNFTIDAWIKPTDSSSARYCIISKRNIDTNSNSQGYVLYLSGTHLTLQLAYGSGYSNFTMAAIVPLGVYSFVAAVVDRTNGLVRLYLNNTIQTFVLNGWSSRSFGNSVGVSIGQLSQSTFGYDPFKGYIDELEIFNRDLDSATLRSIYNAGPDGKCKNIGSSGSNCTPAPAELIAWWPFDETNPTNGSTAIDLTSVAASYFPTNYNDYGTIVGSGITSNSSNYVGGSFHFPFNPNSYINVTQNALDLDFNTSNFSIDCWIKLDSLGDNGLRTIIVKRVATDATHVQGYAFFVDGSNKLGFQLGYGNSPAPNFQNFLSVTSIPINTWTFVAATVNRGANTVKLLTNTAQTIVPISASLTNSISNNANVTIGRDFVNGSNEFSGSIDELEIFKGAIDTTKLMDIYRAGPAGKCKTLDTVPTNTICDSIANISFNKDSSIYCFDIINKKSSSIYSIDFNMTGAVIASMTCTTCSSYLSGLNLSQGFIAFVPACTSNIIHICLKTIINSGNTSGNVSLNLATIHTYVPPNLGDTCRFQQNYQGNGNQITLPCDSLMNSSLDTSNCTYCFDIANKSPIGINSMKLNIFNGTINSLTVNQPTSSIVGGMITFSPKCTASTIHICLKATPTNPNSLIVLNWETYHASDSTHKADSCRIVMEYKCKNDTIPHSNTNSCGCDSLRVGPDIDIQSQFFGHHYTIIKNPYAASNICSVMVSISPAPCYGSVTGGDCHIDGVLNNAAFPLGYTQITAGGGGAHNNISFYYGLNWNCPGPYVVTITTIHCNGDSCVYHDTLSPKPVLSISGLGSYNKPTDSLRAITINLVGNDKLLDAVKFVSVEVLNNTGILKAILSGELSWGDGDADMSSCQLSNAMMNQHRALFTLKDPLKLLKGQISKGITLVYIPDTIGKNKLKLKLALFNDRGDPLGYDSSDVISSVSIGSITHGFDGNEFELLKSVPNPGQDQISLTYIIGAQSDIRLAIYDNLGNEVQSFNEGFKSQGLHTIDINTSSLLSGVYYIRLISPIRSASLELIINK